MRKQRYGAKQTCGSSQVGGASVVDDELVAHERLTYRYQGLDARLTGVEKAEVIKALLA